MASSIDSCTLTSQDNVGAFFSNHLQKLLNDESKSAESAELTTSTTPTNSQIDNMMFLDRTNNVNNNVTDNTNPSSQSPEIINTYVENFDTTEKRIVSTVIPPSTPIQSNTDSTSLIGEQQSQDRTPPPHPHQPEVITEPHIMISYNSKSFEVCQKIHDRLEELGYKVWMDEYDLHGRILEGIAQAIEKSHVVLVCYTEDYFKSDYCYTEACYIYEKRIDFIPCRLQTLYKPDGWLGAFIADRLYFDFTAPNDFESVFKKLVDEIKSIKTRSQTYAAKRNSIFRWYNKNRNFQINKERMHEQFDKIIREYKESINKSNEDLKLLDKEQLCELIIRLRERLFDDSLLSSNHNPRNSEEQNLNNNNNNNQILQEMFKHVKTQTELLQQINETLSKATDFKSIVKLSMAVLFTWTVKTHIIDAYLKQK